MSKRMLVSLALVLAMLLPVATSAAPLKQEEMTYTVKLGDNLWTLAEKYLGRGPAYWAIVFAANEKAQEDETFAAIANPDLIHPGWKLFIPSAEEANDLLSGYTSEIREVVHGEAAYRATVYTHRDWHLHPSYLLISKSQGGRTTLIYNLREERQVSLFAYTPQGEQRLDWVDMNGDGLMELPYRVYQGGNCWTCLQMQVLQVRADDSVINLTESAPSEDRLGDKFALGSLTDVDNDGLLEWVVGDARFEFAFDLCHACSPSAVRLYAWDGETYRNASAQFPGYYQERIDELTAQVEQMAQSDEPWTGYELGPMISLLLAYENAGQREEGLALFEQYSDPELYAERASEEQLQSLREARDFFLSESASPFADPFNYCAAVGTIDAPDVRYVGPEAPDAIVEGLKKELEMSDDAPAEWFVAGTVWRCMGGKVLACFVGTNLPCTAKADTSRTPTPAMVDFCEANPTSDFIPAVVTGRETVYEWRCTDGVPEIVKELFKPDAQGFLSDFWYEISPGDDS